MSGTSYTDRRRPRWGLMALLVGLHAFGILGLARALAPEFTTSALEEATALITVTVTSTPPEPQPEPSPSPEPSPQPDEGAAAEAGVQAVPRAVTAPPARIVLPNPVVVPIAPAIGLAVSAGAREAGTGTGAGGEGAGTGSGRAGTGRGGVAITRPVKIEGDINNARDYPVPPGGREIRLGHSVTITMTVTPDGRARDCRVVEPSPDPVADRMTCELAEERFRFRPARDAEGNPVAAAYGWRQSWFRK
jgi:protein TonB